MNALLSSCHFAYVFRLLLVWDQLAVTPPPNKLYKSWVRVLFQLSYLSVCLFVTLFMVKVVMICPLLK